MSMSEITLHVASGKNQIDISNWFNSYSQERDIRITGSGGKWEIVIDATRDLPSFCIYGDSLSDVLTNFKKYIDIDTISKFRQAVNAVNKAAENNKVENDKIKKLWE